MKYTSVSSLRGPGSNPVYPGREKLAIGVVGKILPMIHFNEPSNSGVSRVDGGLECPVLALFVCRTLRKGHLGNGQGWLYQSHDLPPLKFLESHITKIIYYIG